MEDTIQVTPRSNSIRSRLSQFIADGRAWSLFPVVLLGILVTVQGVLYSLSTNDPSFSVEPDYYQKAVNWDAHRDRQASSDRLGWTAAASVVGGENTVLRIELRDAQQQPVRVEQLQVEAFANSRAADVQTLRPEEIAPGVYAATLRVTQPGVWEVRLRAQRGADIFHRTLRVQDVGAVKPTPYPTTE